MTPRRYYAYLKWLRKNGYIAQEKRGADLQLTFKGREHVESLERWELLYRTATEQINKTMPEALKEIGSNDVSEYVEAAVRQQAIKILWRPILKTYPTTWKAQLEETHLFLDLIMKLDLDEKQKLRNLLDRYIQLERLEESKRKSKYEIVDSGRTLTLRDRETGLIHPGLVIHKYPEKEEKG